MTQTPARILREHADSLPGNRPQFNPKELAQQEKILTTATSLMAKYSRPAITMRGLASALRIAPITIKKYFVDLDTILFEILRRHILKIQDAMAEIPSGAPNRAAAKRAAYIKYTRTEMGGIVPAHRLLINERQTLPPDLAKELETWRTAMGWMAGGDHWEVALTLLDCEVLQAPQIEAMLAAHASIPFQPDVPDVDPFATPPEPLPKQLPKLHIAAESPFIPVSAQLKRAKAQARNGPH